MRKELRFESSAGIELNGVSLGQKVFAFVVSSMVAIMLVALSAGIFS